MKQTPESLEHLSQHIKMRGIELGFQQIGIADLNLSDYTPDLIEWLKRDYHGTMHYMEAHQDLRRHPQKLVPGAVRAIMARMDYYPSSRDTLEIMKDKTKGVISRYATGRDYHKLIRKRLAKLAAFIETAAGPIIYRPFADSAPIMEKPLAEKAGLGWIGKHTILLNHGAGSWFFLGSLLINLPLPIDSPVKPRCGSCTRCIDICPTQAIVGPGQLDARRCISYLTIENKGPIPIEFRKPIGNRIYGCDDCQLVCPWNRYAKKSLEPDFQVRHNLDEPNLLALFAWDESTFNRNLEGSAIRRIGHQAWLRNIAVALGNAPHDETIIDTLRKKLDFQSPLVQEHCAWALEQQLSKAP